MMSMIVVVENCILSDGVCVLNNVDFRFLDEGKLLNNQRDSSYGRVIMYKLNKSHSLGAVI